MSPLLWLLPSVVLVFTSSGVQSYPEQSDGLEGVGYQTVMSKYHIAVEENRHGVTVEYGRPASDPCCVARSDGTYCFYRRGDGFLYGKRLRPPMSWKNLKIKTIGDIECLKLGNGDAVVIAVDADNVVKSLTISRPFFGDWTETQARNVQEVPGCTPRGKDMITCMYRDKNSNAVVMHAARGKWTSPVNLEESLYGPPACFGDEEKFSCFGVDEKFYLKEYLSDLKKWEQHQHRKVMGRPSLTTHGRSTIDICMLSPATNNVLFSLGLRSRRYKGFEPILTETTNFEPVCVGGEDRVDCFVVGGSSVFAHRTWYKGHWGPWNNLGQGFIGKPSCVYSKESIITCLVRTVDGGGFGRFDVTV